MRLSETRTNPSSANAGLIWISLSLQDRDDLVLNRLADDFDVGNVNVDSDRTPNFASVATNARYTKLGANSLTIGTVLVVLIPFLRKLITDKAETRPIEAKESCCRHLKNA